MRRVAVRRDDRRGLPRALRAEPVGGSCRSVTRGSTGQRTEERMPDPDKTMPTLAELDALEREVRGYIELNENTGKLGLFVKPLGWLEILAAARLGVLARAFADEHGERADHAACAGVVGIVQTDERRAEWGPAYRALQRLINEARTPEDNPAVFASLPTPAEAEGGSEPALTCPHCLDPLVEAEGVEG